MANSAPPPTQTTTEGGGFVVTCTCRWLRFAATRNDAAEYRRLHELKCKAGDS